MFFLIDYLGPHRMTEPAFFLNKTVMVRIYFHGIIHVASLFIEKSLFLYFGTSSVVSII